MWPKIYTNGNLQMNVVDGSTLSFSQPSIEIRQTTYIHVHSTAIKDH